MIGKLSDFVGRLVAVKDQAGITVTAANHGTFSESWRQVFPDPRVYHVETLVDGAGQLVYSEDPDGHRTTASYYEDGTAKSSFWSDDENVPHKHMIIEEARANMFGQTEWVKYGDDAGTVAWNGYDPVTHQPLSTVVQQQAFKWIDPVTSSEQSSQVTLLAFGYQYDAVGKLIGIADWRGRGPGQPFTFGDLSVSHPTTFQHQVPGYHHAVFPEEFDTNLSAPPQVAWTDNDTIPPLGTGWPEGSAPSDAAFDYDTLYQLVGEDRNYITETGDDPLLGEDVPESTHRVRELSWQFDERGSMTAWEEIGQPDSHNWGRALGGKIVNGYQLNQQAGLSMDVLAGADWNDEIFGTFKKPDAIYFATNLFDSNGDQGVPAEKGRCIWARYDQAGQLKEQIIRTGCSVCGEAFADALNNDTTQCPGFAGLGTPGQAVYEPPIEAETTRYEYTWNRSSQLVGAVKYAVDGTQHELTMSYKYDASGVRVVREKSEGTGVSDVYHDLYITGKYERRKVQLQDESGSQTTLAGVVDGETYRYKIVDGTREVKYSSGIRIQRKHEDGLFQDWQLFISFGNHLGTASAVVDFEDGTLVEWRTHYAYGATESHWTNKKLDPENPTKQKYENTEEPYGFTGKEEDEEIGLHYFGARYYSSYLGRWTGPDPPVIQESGLGNHYNYGANSPYIYVDPDGNRPWVVPEEFRDDWIAFRTAYGGGSEQGLIGGATFWTMNSPSKAVTALQQANLHGYNNAMQSALFGATGTALLSGEFEQQLFDGIMASGGGPASSGPDYGFSQALNDMTILEATATHPDSALVQADAMLAAEIEQFAHEVGRIDVATEFAKVQAIEEGFEEPIVADLWQPGPGQFDYLKGRGEVGFGHSDPNAIHEMARAVGVNEISTATYHQPLSSQILSTGTQTTIHEHLGEFFDGVASYGEGIYRTFRYSARLAGVMGEEEKARANLEGYLFIDLTSALMNNPEAQELAFETAEMYVRNHPARVSGRVIAGAGVTMMLTKGLGGYGTGLGMTLNIAAINGDIRYGIEHGVRTVEDYVRQVVGGKEAGI